MTDREDIVEILSAHPYCAPHLRPTVRVAEGFLVAIGIVFILALLFFGRVDLLHMHEKAEGHGFVLNFLFVMSVALSALAVVRDLSIPAKSSRLSRRTLAALFVLMAVVVAHELMDSSLHELANGAHAVSWFSCFWQILLLAAPAFIILSVTVRRLAPVRLRQTGAYVGTLAGALGAMGHCWHVPTDPAAFGALLYTTAIAGTTAFGAWTGPRLLRWS